MSNASEFSTVELGSLFETVHGGGTPPRNNPDYWNGNIPWASVKDFSDNQFTLEQTEEHITDFGLQNSTSKLIPENIPVICLRMAVGRSALTAKPISINQDLKALFPRKDVDPKYIVYLLQQFRDVIEAKAIGSTVKGVSTKELLRTGIPFPNTIKIQQKIAKILTTIDQLIEKTQNLIDKHTAIKQGMMADLFTRGIDPATGQLRPPVEQAPHLYKETELGWVPKEWVLKRVKEIGVVKGGKRLPAGTPFSTSPTKYPYLRVSDMVDGGIDDSALEYITEDTEKLISRYKIYSSDIYVTIAGTLGLFGRIPELLSGAQLTENAARITEIDESIINTNYLCFYLRSDKLQPQIYASIGVGAGVPKLALYHIENFLFPKPELKEQEASVKKLTIATFNIVKERKYLEKIIKIKNGLMQDLLTGKVRVIKEGVC